MAAPMPRVPPVTNATRAIISSRYHRYGRRLPAIFLVITNAAERRELPVSALEAHRDAHAAADAQRGQALLRIALLHFVQEGDQHARTRRTDRMSDGDGA